MTSPRTDLAAQIEREAQPGPLHDALHAIGGLAGWPHNLPPDEVGRLLALVRAAVPSEAVTPLDPERLARALQAWDDNPPGYSTGTIWDEAAPIIAREYASLPTDRPTDHGITDPNAPLGWQCGDPGCRWHGQAAIFGWHNDGDACTGPGCLNPAHDPVVIEEDSNAG